MANIKDLLKQYADTCEAISRLSARMFGAHGLEINSLEKRKANLESQIIKLFEGARSEGAQVEREAIVKIAEDYELGRAVKRDWMGEMHARNIIKAIRKRAEQSVA